MHAWLHALRLTRNTWVDTLLSVNLCVSFTTDWGTEARLSTHAACSIKHYFPWISEDTEARAFDFGAEPDAETSADEELRPFDCERQHSHEPGAGPDSLLELPNLRFRGDLDSVSDDARSPVADGALQLDEPPRAEALPAPASPRSLPDVEDASDRQLPQASAAGPGNVPASLRFTGAGDE
eukprot:2838013-Alexandrium_andersonii.AAC.1